jgi:hypothetical protein
VCNVSQNHGTHCIKKSVRATLHTLNMFFLVCVFKKKKI